MKRDFIICGYYTKNTPYEEEIKNLAATCKIYDLKVHLQGFESRGSWVHNCAIKSEFVSECLQRFRDHNIVYIDADGKIQQYPKLFINLDVDIAVHYLNGKELISNTIFFQNNTNVQQLVRHWIDAQHSQPEVWDQKVLQWCIDKYKVPMNLNIMQLPPTYSQIFDTMRNAGKPVIEHFQASRRFKKIVNGCKDLPALIAGIRPRKLDDGTIYLTRCTPAIERLMDKDYCRITNENRWYPRSFGGLPMLEIAPFFADKECYIVGKGPSLDKLSIEDFPNKEAPVICINEAIHRIESLGLPNKLFILVQDTWLKDTCKPSFPETIMLVNTNCQHWYAGVRNKLIFHFGEIGLIKKHISVIYAIAISKMCGTKKFTLLAFDAAMTQDTGYAVAVGYLPTKGGDPKRFLSHNIAIRRHADPIPLTFTPAVLASPSPCKP